MKKFLVFIVMVSLLSVGSLAAEDGKKINLFANAGIAFSDFEGLFVDLGAEMQINGPIWAQILLDYYANPSGVDIPGVSDTAYGFNLYGVYKIGKSEKMNLFAKAGVHYTTVKASTNVLGIEISASESKFGIAGGAGLEMKLGQKLFLLAGATVKTIFTEETGTWFKVYAGVGIPLK